MHGEVSFNVYVIEGIGCLLGRRKIGLVKRLTEVSDVFGAGGLFKMEPVKIGLHEDTQPSAVHVARRIPFLLESLLKKDGDRRPN